ncbi:MAG: hypothetical protein H0T46_34105 [Deltaproteobacteria bacterium]|nr:hypothetical protein [Deltaproteobacteria bacterium]
MRSVAAQPADQPVPAPAPVEVPAVPAPVQPPAPVIVTPPPQPLVEVEPEPDADAEPEKQGFKVRRNFAGSIQLDYMAIPTEKTGRQIALDGATAEASLKVAIDFNGRISANVKMCVACHGVEVGMAYFDLRVADELNFRVGRFTPAFGEFPVRHDPANHRTSDKPLPYDMGRMLRINDYNEGVLPSPWVDNGIELNGTHFFGDSLQLDYAAYAIGGPRAGADPVDFDFKMSRSGESYYVDNNSRPVLGGQIVASIVTPKLTWSAGVSMMRGTYDPEHKLRFSIIGAHMVLRAKDVFLRLEYLTRRTKMSLGEDPMERFKYGPGANGEFDPYMVKDGGYAELEIPITSRLTVLAREDALRRRGNVVKNSGLRSDSVILRHTAGVAVGLWSALRLKVSYEYYDFSDFENESVIHLGVVGPF